MDSIRAARSWPVPSRGFHIGVKIAAGCIELQRIFQPCSAQYRATVFVWFRTAQLPPGGNLKRLNWGLPRDRRLGVGYDAGMPRVAKPKPTCAECGKVTMRVNPILDIPLCAHCQRGHPDKYGYITKTRARGEYRLRESDLARLASYEVDNPHYKKAAPMQLYLHQHVRKLSREKYGEDEPYIVSIIPFSEDQLRWFAEDPDRIRAMSPRSFQRFVADRLDAMGLEVQMVGDVYRKDGGLDLIAYPKRDRCQFPFLLAVQAKHHHLGHASTTVSEVRDFHGAFTSRGLPFGTGLLVTNTSFTPDAQWFADNNRAILRLRDLEDLKRWLRNDFENESEWREIPESIEVAPGVRIFIPRKSVIVPKR